MNTKQIQNKAREEFIKKYEKFEICDRISVPEMDRLLAILENTIASTIKATEERKDKEFVEMVEKLKQNENPTEDGVPVETYGYEETHNQALDNIIKELKD